jgi:predicted MFS family arabinose efflux permease
MRFERNDRSARDETGLTAGYAGTYNFLTPPMQNVKTNVSLLAACQALLFTNNTTAIAINGLAGFALATDKALATLPATGLVIGGALATFPASLLMKRVGRRAGFLAAAAVGFLGAILSSAAVFLGDFWLLCLGTIVLGMYNGGAQYYRFAAADVSPPGFKERAISLVIAGGLVGGLIGPETSKYTVDLFSARYAGAYLGLCIFQVLAMLLLLGLRVPPPGADELKGEARPISEIMAQPVFLVAAFASALGYGVMNLLMTATPLAMEVCGHPFASAAFVIQWHVVGMFAPSFFTGGLIKRYGVINIMLVGAALQLLCVAIALAGISVAHFWFSLVVLGIGWNFLFIGGTTLATQAYRPAEKAKAQGANDLIIFLVMATSSFLSGLLHATNGWEMLNYLAIIPVFVIVAGLLWLSSVRRTPAGA